MEDPRIGESEKQIFSVTTEQLLSFINDRFTAKECSNCSRAYSVQVMTESGDMPVVAQYSLARTPHAGVWVFLISCSNCGTVSMIHTEAVREWMFESKDPVGAGGVDNNVE